MHELAITQNIIDIATQKAQEVGAEKVTGISIVAGALTGVVEDCIRFYFDIVAKGTVLENAEITFCQVPTKARCRSCASEYYPSDSVWQCPSCQQLDAEIIAGRELFLESIEIDRNPNSAEHTGS